MCMKKLSTGSASHRISETLACKRAFLDLGACGVGSRPSAVRRACVRPWARAPRSCSATRFSRSAGRRSTGMLNLAVCVRELFDDRLVIAGEQALGAIMDDAVGREVLFKESSGRGGREVRVRNREGLASGRQQGLGARVVLVEAEASFATASMGLADFLKAFSAASVSSCSQPGRAENVTGSKLTLRRGALDVEAPSGMGEVPNLTG